MNKVLRILSVLTLCVPLIALAPQASEAAPASWAIGTSSSGSSPYKLGANLAKALSGKQSAVTLSAQATAGFNENLFLVAAGEIPMAMITSLDLTDAYNERKAYAGNPQFKKLRRMFLYAVEHGHQFVRADSDIKVFMDIKGRKFNMNTPASITSIRNDNMLAAFGLSRKDVKVVEIATSGAFDAIRDNVADMSANGMSIGNASLMELASSVPIRLIEIPEDVFPKFKELMGGSVDYGVIPAGSYNGQTEDVKTWVGYNLLFTSEDVDEEAIYAITKAYWESLPELEAMDRGFKLVTKELAPFGPQDVPLHPGVVRYFKEVGFLK